MNCILVSLNSLLRFFYIYVSMQHVLSCQEKIAKCRTRDKYLSRTENSVGQQVRFTQ